MYRCFFLILLSFGLALEAAKPTICLNMIVKNESAVIKRCLDSVKPLIDSWVIVDTGSTDGTQEIIREHMKDIPGKLYERPWKNFGFNRTEAILLAKDRADYLLIMDADDYLEYEPDFKLPKLTCDMYQIWQGNRSFSYLIPRLIRTNLPWKWVGVLHEYLDAGRPVEKEALSGVYYVYTGDGACSKDPEKYLKHAKLLEDGLKEEPDNARYMFYLGQSYKDAGNHEKSIEWYKKRVEFGGWAEETYLSLMGIAHQQKQLGYPLETVIESYYRAFRFRPHRAEAPFHLASLYEEMGRQDLAFATLKAYEYVAKPKEKDVLFVETWIDDWGMLFKKSITAYYAGFFEESLEACDQLLKLKTLSENYRDQTIKNREFALQRVTPQQQAA